MLILSEEDPVLKIALEAVTVLAQEQAEIRDHNLAVKVAKAVWG